MNSRTTVLCSQLSAFQMPLLWENDCEKKGFIFQLNIFKSPSIFKANVRKHLNKNVASPGHVFYERKKIFLRRNIKTNNAICMVVFYELSATLRKNMKTSVEVSAKFTGVRHPTESPRACPRIMWETDLEMLVSQWPKFMRGIGETWKAWENLYSTLVADKLNQVGGGEEKPVTGRTKVETHGRPVFSSHKRTVSTLQSSRRRGNKAPWKTAFPWKEFIVLRRKWNRGIQFWDKRVFQTEMSVPKLTEMKVSKAVQLPAVIFSLKAFLLLLFVLSTQRVNSNRIRRQNKWPDPRWCHW